MGAGLGWGQREETQTERLGSGRRSSALPFRARSPRGTKAAAGKWGLRLDTAPGASGSRCRAWNRSVIRHCCFLRARF